jgi:hypothetical protein
MLTGRGGIGRRFFQKENMELVCGCRCGCVTSGAQHIRCTSCSRLLSTDCRCLVDWLGNPDHALCHVCEEDSEARAIERCNEAGEECWREDQVDFNNKRGGKGKARRGTSKAAASLVFPAYAGLARSCVVSLYASVCRLWTISYCS